MSNVLDADEVSIIKTMLTLRPNLNNQEILSYFTRPGRDINHARIAEIRGGNTWTAVPPAPVSATLAYMTARASLPYQAAAQFLQSGARTLATGPTLAALQVTCWPVGQGLFMSGRLHGAAGGNFSWVYDCGSSSASIVRDKAVASFRNENGRRFINLVTLSHFDEDHINGIVELMRGTRIGALLLPYLPVWQRLLIAISEGIEAADPLFSFFVDPAAYLTQRGEIDEIVYVPPAGPDDIAPGAGEEPDPDRPIESAKIEEGGLPEDSADDPALVDRGSTRMRVLKPGGRIVIPSLWEFVPYNDAKMQPRVSPRFELWAHRLSSIIICDPKRRDRALRIIKKVYDRTFGATSTPRNLISLFLYSGPVGTRTTLRHAVPSHPVRWNAARDNFAQLSTGDGYLNNAPRLNALRRFYGRDRRLERAGLLQVMHHGAEGNWHPGVAAVLAPAVSLFSSDPANKKLGHPHAAVLRDFWTFCPVQVDAANTFRLHAILALP